MSGLSNSNLSRIYERCEGGDEFAQRLRPMAYKGLSLREMRLAIKLLRDFPEPRTTLKIAVLGSYTTELLRDYWTLHALLHGFEPDLYIAPYGQVIQELRSDSDYSRHAPEFTYLLLQWSDIVPGLGDPLHACDERELTDLIQLFEESLRKLVTVAREATAGPIVLSFLGARNLPGLGLYDVMAESSELHFRLKLKEVVSSLLREEFPSIYFDDGDFLTSTLGNDGAFDARLWYTSRFPFSVKGANLFVNRLFRFPVLLHTPLVKCVVLDCDNTLWGGIIGEDGMAGIKLGPEYPGRCFVDFQRHLLNLLHRGYLLAICSKNNIGDVQQVIREHPHMILREDHFAAIRVNWDPKPDNLRSIADELRLGLDSFLFVDDSSYECGIVSKFTPEVRVVQVPDKALDIPTCLDHLQELELLSFTAEDRTRSKMYVQERQRRVAAVASQNISEYLASLEMRMRISVNMDTHVTRLAQMTQKTNQFNLTTKRYNEKDMQAFIHDPDWFVAHFSLSDIFGDNGIVGLLMVSGMKTDNVEIDSFLMSCRVIGRQAEEAFLNQVLQLLRDLGKTKVNGHYIPTLKNGLVHDFFDRQGFRKLKEGVYEFCLQELPEGHPSLVHFEVEIEEENS